LFRPIALSVDERAVAAGGSAEHGPWIRRRAGLQLDQLESIAAVQRQFGDALLVNEVRDPALFGVDEGRVSLDRDGFGDGADLENEVQPHDLADGQEDARLGQRLEPLELRRHRVGAARQVRETVEAVDRRHGGPGVVRAGMDSGDRHTWQDGAARVSRGTRQVCARPLSERRRGAEESDEADEAHQSPHTASNPNSDVDPVLT